MLELSWGSDWLVSDSWRHYSIVLGLRDELLLTRQMLLDISSEARQYCVETHFILVALQGVCILACVVFQCHEGLQQGAVLVREVLAGRVLLDFSLASESLPAAALERENLISEQIGITHQALVQ